MNANKQLCPYYCGALLKLIYKSHITPPCPDQSLSAMLIRLIMLNNNTLQMTTTALTEWVIIGYYKGRLFLMGTV